MLTKQQNIIIFWFRNDLRLRDNEALLAAIANAQYVVPVYCINPDLFEKNTGGFAKMGMHRAKFLLQSLRDIQHLLREIGGDLLIRIGKPEAVLFALAKYHKVKAVYCHEVPDYQGVLADKKLENHLNTINVPLKLFWGSSMHHFDDLPFDIDDLPKDFKQYVEAMQNVSVRETLPVPPKLQLPPDVVGDKVPSLNEIKLETPNYDKSNTPKFKGGETHGLLRLKRYLYETDEETELLNQLTYGIAESKHSLLSPWLNNGGMSPRTFYFELKKYEKQNPQGAANCRQAIRALMLRDFFQFASMKRDDVPKWQNFGVGNVPHSPKVFEKWRNGNTGFPIVDASMRRLNQTGWLPHWARRLMAGFYLHFLPCNPSLGEAYFESRLVDGDPCSNYGNWEKAATQSPPGVIAFAKKHDPNGLFIKKWCPELKKIPSSRIHQPHLLNEVEQRVLRINIGKDYPLPCVVLLK